MTGLSFTVSRTISASKEEIYQAWLDSDSHTAMTGGKAVASDQPNAAFKAWDGYISGTNMILEPNCRIVQSWRTTEFTENEASSKIEINLETVSDGTQITLRHTNLPEHGMQYKQGWQDHYFEPMTAYFEGE